MYLLLLWVLYLLLLLSLAGVVWYAITASLASHVQDTWEAEVREQHQALGIDPAYTERVIDESRQAQKTADCKSTAGLDNHPAPDLD